MADAELEEPFPELLAPFCLTDVDPAVTQHVLEAGKEHGQLNVRQIRVHPLFDWTPALIASKNSMVNSPALTDRTIVAGMAESVADECGLSPNEVGSG
jgi:hypothetical protein